MITGIVVEVVALATVAALCFVLQKSETKKWNDCIVILFEIGIAAAGSGLIYLLTGRNPVIECFQGLVQLSRQHLSVLIALISLNLAVCIEWGNILCMISPQYRRWAEGHIKRGPK
jgi:hypothetical protein